MIASGFSCPSTIFVCSAEYTSLKLMLAGDASSDLNIDVHNGLTGTLILKPFRSAGVTMGLLELVIWRNPLSQILSNATRLALAMAARTCAPRSPSIAAQTCS